MFDNLGRVLCNECFGSMKTIDADDGEVLFFCTNETCNHSIVLTWPVLPANNDFIEASNDCPEYDWDDWDDLKLVA